MGVGVLAHLAVAAIEAIPAALETRLTPAAAILLLRVTITMAKGNQQTHCRSVL